MGKIQDFVEAFHRDRAQYETVQKEVEDLCKSKLRDIDFLWQSRVKAAKSLEDKLEARKRDYESESENVDKAWDLIAGRIILARWLDIEKVEKIVHASFDIIAHSQHPKPGRDIGNLKARFRGYDGLHFYVRRQNVTGLPLPELVIEIQVMTAFMWAFSTLAHDITYKQLSGEPDKDMLQSLDLLKGIANTGEIAIQIFETRISDDPKHASQSHSTSPRLQATIRSVAAEIGLDESDKQCLRDLQLTDPRDDKSRIEASKDEPLEGSCSWVLEDQAFVDWSTRDDSPLLWIHGDPGKGKTIMMMALVFHMEKKLESLPGSNVLAYFFCQNTNSDLNTTVSVLRGLIYLLVDQERMLIRHLRKRYDGKGTPLFQDQNTQHALLDVLLNILKDPDLRSVCLMIDALDECDNQIHELLKWIIKRNPELSPKIKWLITSRNEPAFTDRLGPGKTPHIDLELNSSHVTRAIVNFIEHKIRELAGLKMYNNELQALIKETLLEKAEGTFLWVALVCKALEGARRGKEMSFLEATPAGLVPLYERMLHLLLHQADQDDMESCRRILCSVTLAFRPLRLEEIVVFAKISRFHVEVLVGYCGSFLIIREGIAYLIHSSAKDYLSGSKRNDIFISGQGNEHANTVALCLEIMSGTLKKDICELKMPGTRPSDVDESRLGARIPFHVQYACLYWIDHLQQAQQECTPWWASHTEQKSLIMREDGHAFEFFQRHFLHWLETLSLMSKVSEAVTAMTSLCSIPESRMSTELFSFAQDAWRFILEFRSVMEIAPLQLYNSASIFSPETSIVRRLFSNQMPKWIDTASKAEKNWTTCLQTLEGHSDSINAVSFSADGKLLASASNDGTVILWNPITGILQRTLKATRSMFAKVRHRSEPVSTVAFSPDGQLIASMSSELIEIWNPITGQSCGSLETGLDWPRKMSFSPIGQLLASDSWFAIKLWEPITKELRGTLEGHSGTITAIIFSPDGQLLASASCDKTIRLWNPITVDSRCILGSHEEQVNAVVFSPNGHLLASASDDKTIKLWDPIEEKLLYTFEGHSSGVNRVVFSPNGPLLASASNDSTVRLWDSDKKESRGVFDGHSSPVNMVVFSPKGHLLASASDDKTIKLWDPVNNLQGSLEGHLSGVKAAVFSVDGLLASASRDNTVRLWNPIIGDSRITSDVNHSDKVNAVVFSPDGQLVASASDDNTIRLWDSTGESRSKLEGHSNPVTTIAFSPNGRLLASGSGVFSPNNEDYTIRLWDPLTGESRGKLEGHSNPVNTIAFSPDGQLLASGDTGGFFQHFNVRLWNPFTRELRRILEGHEGEVRVVTFSPNGELLASASGLDSLGDPRGLPYDNTLKFWDPITGALHGTLEGHLESIVRIVFSPDRKILASASLDDIVRLWHVEEKILLHQIPHQYTGRMIFNEDGSRLVLDSRVFEISSTSLTAFPQERTSTDGSYALSINHEWVSWRGHNILWLPFNHRPSAYAFRDNTLVMGSGGGRMTFVAFSTTVLPF